MTIEENVQLWTQLGVIIVAGLSIIISVVTNKRNRRNGSTSERILIVEQKLVNMEEDLKEHLKASDKKFEKIKEQNTTDHRLLFKQLDGIKDYLITGQFPD